MAKLECSKCGNKKKFNGLHYVNGKYSATCGKCGNLVTGTGSLEIGKAGKGITFNFTK